MRRSKVFARTHPGISGGSPLVGWARMRDVVSVLVAGDTRESAAVNYGLTLKQVERVIDAAGIEWIDEPERQQICDLINQAYERQEDAALEPNESGVEVALWRVWDRLTRRMDRVRADVVWASLWNGHIRLALTILFLPRGYSLKYTRPSSSAPKQEAG